MRELGIDLAALAQEFGGVLKARVILATMGEGEVFT
jgi:hypothetical protein